MSIPQQLYNRCRTIMINCDEFGEQGKLESLFVSSELEPFKDRLPEARDKGDRVDKTLNFLITYSYSVDNIFSFFFTALRDRYRPGDGKHAEIQGLLEELQNHFSSVSSIEIPVVIVAMNKAQAAELFTPDFYDHPPLTPDEARAFREFRDKLLEEDEIDTLVSHYSDSRDKWRPHIQTEKSIDEIIAEIFMLYDDNKINKSMSSIVKPRFQTDKFFSEKEVEKFQTWEELSSSGCVLIVDTVSFFHPEIRQILTQSGIIAYENVAVFTLSPVAPKLTPLASLLEQEHKTRMSRAFRRYDTLLDKLCELNINDIRMFRRWLFSVLPDTAGIIGKQRPLSGNLQKVRAKVGEAQGLEQLIF